MGKSEKLSLTLNNMMCGLVLLWVILYTHSFAGQRQYVVCSRRLAGRLMLDCAVVSRSSERRVVKSLPCGVYTILSVPVMCSTSQALARKRSQRASNATGVGRGQDAYKALDFMHGR